MVQTPKNKDLIGNSDQKWNELTFVDVVVTKQWKSEAAFEIWNVRGMFAFSLNTC